MLEALEFFLSSIWLQAVIGISILFALFFLGTRSIEKRSKEVIKRRSTGVYPKVFLPVFLPRPRLEVDKNGLVFRTWLSEHRSSWKGILQANITITSAGDDRVETFIFRTKTQKIKFTNHSFSKGWLLRDAIGRFIKLKKGQPPKSFSIFGGKIKFQWVNPW